MIRKFFVAALSLAALVAFSTAQAEVARTIVTTGVTDREPVNDLQQVPAEDQKVFFFTELRGMKGESVTHVWKRDGEVMAEVKFDVGGPRWRVWSSKNMLPDWTGAWTVEVVGADGKVIASKEFTYGEAAMEKEGEMSKEKDAGMTMGEDNADAMDKEESSDNNEKMSEDQPAKESDGETMKEGE
jgi:hypothetical protein